MSDATTFTELEEGLFGPDGTTVLRATAGRLIAMRSTVSSFLAEGLSPQEAAVAAQAVAAIDAAERIIIDITASGD